MLVLECLGIASGNKIAKVNAEICKICFPEFYKYKIMNLKREWWLVTIVAEYNTKASRLYMI